MADDAPKPDDDIDAEAPEDGDKKILGRFSRKTAIIAAAALVLVLAGGGAAMVLLLGDGGGDATLALPGPSTYVDLPEMVADLRTGRCRSPVVKLTVTVELDGAHAQRLKDGELQLLDGIRTLLRDRAREDLMGKEGTERLRFDIQTVVDSTLAPDASRGLYFKELLLR